MENTILTNMLVNDEYVRKILPYTKPEYFEDYTNRSIFEVFAQYFDKYNSVPTRDELSHEVAELTSLTEDSYAEIIERIPTLIQAEIPNEEWLTNKTEQYYQDRAIYIAVMDSISILDGDDPTKTKHSLPDLLKDALSVSFDNSIGHDYFINAPERYEYYHTEENRIPFSLTILNEITNGGAKRKTLNCIMGDTGSGKSMLMVDLATNYMMDGLNVLYITLEMSEEEIANRIDANLFDKTIIDVTKLSEDKFMSGVSSFRNKTKGELVIREYPTAAAHVGHIRTLLQELKLKKNFKPDVIVVDYLNIMASARVTLGAGSYTFVKSIAEELRGLAVEFDAMIWTGTQSNRGGSGNSDMDLTNTSESYGLPATLDFFIAIIRLPELDALNQVLIKQLKSRYGDKTKKEKFIIGVDVAKQSFYDVEDSAQEDMMQGNGSYTPNDAEGNGFEDFQY